MLVKIKGKVIREHPEVKVCVNERNQIFVRKKVLEVNVSLPSEKPDVVIFSLIQDHKIDTIKKYIGVGVLADVNKRKIDEWEFSVRLKGRVWNNKVYNDLECVFLKPIYNPG